VYPSPAAPATVRAARIWSAPTRCSITIGWPSAARNGCCIVRSMKS
jgi:hypothetical protein